MILRCRQPWRYVVLGVGAALVFALAPRTAAMTQPWEVQSQNPVRATPVLTSPLENAQQTCIGPPMLDRDEQPWCMANQTGERSMGSSGYLDRGQALYGAGQYGEAVAAWQQALTWAERQGNREQQTIAHNYLAIGHQALNQWEAAQAHVAQGLKLIKPDNDFLTAQLLQTRANGQLQTGHAQAALETGQAAAAIYETLGATEPLIRTRINQTWALRTLGFYRRAQRQLTGVQQTLADLPATSLKLRCLQSLGQTLQQVGDLRQAQTVLETGIAIADRLNLPQAKASLQVNLAQTAASLGNANTALSLYQQARAGGDLTTQIDATLHQLALQLQNKSRDWPTLRPLVQSLRPQLLALPPSRWSINAQVYFATRLMDDVGPQQLHHLNTSPKTVAQLLAHARRQARQLSDSQAEAAALGQLGHVYEQTQQWSIALKLTQQALELSPTDAYAEAQWQWQRGRILQAQNQPEPALMAYGAAVNRLDTLQQDLVAINPEVQFSFRDQVEPVYRDYVALLLTDVDQLPVSVQQVRLQTARTTIEALQLAELQNYFREACLTYRKREIETIDANAAIIYPIVLPHRLEVIASLPGEPLQHYGVDLDAAQQLQLFRATRSALHPIRAKTAIVPLGQQLYDWMVRPVAPALVQHKIRTLVFVPDGWLRNLPMAILHDRDRFLIEQYNLALTPGLQLLNSQPITTAPLKVLTAGLSDARQGFRPLPGVNAELQQIQQQVNTEVLLNDAFTKTQVLKTAQDQPFSVIHLATHGQFSGEADETFLLTWDDRIQIRQVNQLLQGTARQEQPLELLVLSACQTAQGDERAALGMAGVAVRSGARSTIATLWSVQDDSTAALMAEFYRLLAEEQLPRGEALRQAQLSLLQQPQFQHPYYWAPFVLIGNWQ